MTDRGKDGLPIVRFDSPDVWERWLDEHHAASPGLWLEIAKKDSGITSVTYADALEVALCYGWIDGQKASRDARSWLQRFTPRSKRSKWSQINCAKAEELVTSGRMRSAGLAEMERAKGDGRWEAAYAGQRTMAVPDDFRKALESTPEAAAFFASLDSRNRYAVLYRVQDAKKSETRARRIAQFVEMLALQRKLY